MLLLTLSIPRLNLKWYKAFILWKDPYSVTIHWKAIGQYFTIIFFIFQISQFAVLEHLSILDLAFLGLIRK